jgi:hypothetical protein
MTFWLAGWCTRIPSKYGHCPVLLVVISPDWTMQVEGRYRGGFVAVLKFTYVHLGGFLLIRAALPRASLSYLTPAVVPGDQSADVAVSDDVHR